MFDEKSPGASRSSPTLSALQAYPRTRGNPTRGVGHTFSVLELSIQTAHSLFTSFYVSLLNFTTSEYVTCQIDLKLETFITYPDANQISASKSYHVTTWYSWISVLWNYGSNFDVTVRFVLSTHYITSIMDFRWLQKKVLNNWDRELLWFQSYQMHWQSFHFVMLFMPFKCSNSSDIDQRDMKSLSLN